MDNTHHLSAVLPAGTTVHDPVASDIECRGEKKQRRQEEKIIIIRLTDLVRVL